MRHWLDRGADRGRNHDVMRLATRLSDSRHLAPALVPGLTDALVLAGA